MRPNKSTHSETDKPIVLIVDDQYRSLRALTRRISTQDFQILWAPDDQQGRALLQEFANGVRIVIIDLKSSGMGGGGFLQVVRNLSPHAAVLICGPLEPFLYQAGMFFELAGPSLKQEINTILLSISRNMENEEKGGGNDGMQGPLRNRYGPIIGCSQSINKIYRLIDNLHDSFSTVLIQGESGTGKELIAQSIHRTGLRKDKPFVAINCGAIPANLMESELFGHERGAFTTAVNRRMGKFEVAHGGTLFLDEIAELDLNLQVKLLRVLQEREFQRVGGNRTYPTDVRIIAASPVNLRDAVGAGQFRDDLFYRLNVIPIHVPPLRNRKGDIPLLLEHFFLKLSEEINRPMPSISREGEKALNGYSYPGNVRELINIVERLLVTCPNGTISFGDLPREVKREAKEESQGAQLLNPLPAEGVPLHEVEKEVILKTLSLTSGNKAAAARMLQITRRRLYLRLDQYLSNESVTPGNTSTHDCHMA